ncbi:hypothetical protein AKJ09_02475 [Labilithrix luteola]|uniref:Transcriptional regulator, LysR family n=1 Tax=Labilithrix luteola TaxID=1391654 RepID=A0A0K1PR12_9BACT|nr:hypothetical protein [Labilithrix luteola]AKU95811.1 hypothetical protein AKJ09_02475 [Labilithrix luteola]
MQRDYEPTPLPMHLVQLPGVASRTSAAFVEFAAKRLRVSLGDKRSA